MLELVADQGRIRDCLELAQLILVGAVAVLVELILVTVKERLGQTVRANELPAVAEHPRLFAGSGRFA